jgi:hypothetical protein
MLFLDTELKQDMVQYGTSFLGTDLKQDIGLRDKERGRVQGWRQGMPQE